MPWDESSYPNAMKNLDERMRVKAIDIANALLEENYDQGRAIPIAISQARKWAERQDTTHGDNDLHIYPHPNGWAIRRESNQRASFVFSTKKEARERAKEMANGDENVNIILHDEEGRIRKYLDV